MKHRLMAIVIAVVASAAATTTATAQQAKKAPGYLGIRFEETMYPRNDRGRDEVIVREVSKDSPADKAGVRIGDEILRINGMVATNGKFAALARTLVEGDTVRLRLKREGKERDATVIAAPRPGGAFAFNRITIAPDSVRRLILRYMDSARVHLDSLRLPNIVISPGDSSIEVRVTPYSRMMPDSAFIRRDSALMRLFRAHPGEPLIIPDSDKRIFFEREVAPGQIFRHMEIGSRSIGGAEFTELDPAMSDYFKTERGLLTLRVAPETPADRAGLQPGDVVMKARDRAVRDVADLRAIIAANPDGVKLEILRKGETRIVELKTPR